MAEFFSYVFHMNTFQPWLTVFTVFVGLALGLFIFLIYKVTFTGVLYSRSYNLSLVMLTMVSSLVIMFMSNNVKLSLGMVGALSIVRFRTAIKDPIDTVFMFWAIAVGIACGAQYFIEAIIGTFLIGIIMLILCSIKKNAALPFLLIIHYDPAANGQIRKMVAQLPHARLKSRTEQRDGVELAIELRVRDNETGFVSKFMQVEGVYDATLIAHQGDMIS
ncbi:MAG: DUF4956 domain-containing protein [Clostridiales bacterium]|nr:DUF4956 domain-containing protein [Clostridiales bacterium]